MTDTAAAVESLFAAPDPPPDPKPRRLHRKKPSTDDGTKEPKRPAPPGKRESLRTTGVSLWRGLAFLAANAGMPGASRALTLQSEAAGPAFDQAIKGTIFDKPLQTLAKIGGNTKELAELIGLPLSAEAYMRDPTPMKQAAFQTALVASLPQIAAARKTAAKEQAKLEADLADLAEMFGKDPGEQVSLSEVALWLMTGSTDGTIPPPPEQPPAPETPAY